MTQSTGTWDSSNLAFLEYLIGENPQSNPYLNSPISSLMGGNLSTSNNSSVSSPSQTFDITPNSLVAITPASSVYSPSAVTSLGVGTASQQGTSSASISNLIYSSNAPISNYGNFKPGSLDSPKNPTELARESQKRNLDDFSDSSDEDDGAFNNTRTSRGKSQKTKKAKLSSEEREANSRAEQQRMASKRYRQKKKMLVEQLEVKLKEVTTEKEKLEREHKNTLDSFSKLQKENLALRRSSNIESSVDIQELEAQLSANVATLFSIIQSQHPNSNDNSLDREIIPFLEKVKENLKCIRKKIG